MGVSMISLSQPKRFFSIIMGIYLLGIPVIHANESSAPQQPAPQETWGNAFNKALNTTLSLAPTLISSYRDASRLSLSNQKEFIGDQPAKPESQRAIKNLMHEQKISNAHAIEIIAMRDAFYQMSLANDVALPTPEIIQKQATFKYNVLGVFATNSCIFIDEDIIDFENKPLLSTFLIKHALRQFKNHDYRNAIFAKIGIGLAKTTALYKAIPLVTDGMQHLTDAIGWTSFSDSQKSGILLGTARFAINEVMCRIIAQSIVQKISSQAFSWYKQYTYQPIDETVVSPEEIIPLIVELTKIATKTTPSMKVTYNNSVYTQDSSQKAEASYEWPGQKTHIALVCMYINELCTLADNLFTTKSIIERFEEEVENQEQENKDVALMLLRIKANFS